MSPTWESDNIQLYCSDCLAMLSELEAESANLCFVDPPYNIGIFCKMSPDAYLEWCEQWIAACSRVLAPNGALWVSHSKPDTLVDISRIIERYGRGRISWVTWDKYNGLTPGQQFPLNKSKLHPQGKRSFDQDAEFFVYHADEGEWKYACGKVGPKENKHEFVFEPIRAYLEGEKKRAGVTSKQIDTYLGNFMSGHYFGRSQWTLPTSENYTKLRECFHVHNGGGDYLSKGYEYLRREHDDLRQEYEGLRYTFNNPGKVSSVWQFPPARKTGHETPKPEALMQRIIETTTNPGDLILDPMMGRGTTGAVAVTMARRFVGCEIASRHFEPAVQRIKAAQNKYIQEGFMPEKTTGESG